MAGNRDVPTLALANLLDDAVKHAPAGGKMTAAGTGGTTPRLHSPLLPGCHMIA